jgi:trimeric autotransporter adhesin
MSIKTLRKRIAVVAVSALAAGVLAVTSAPVANAALPNDITQGDLNLTTTTASPGICSVSTTAGEEAAVIVNGRTFRLTVDSGGTGENIYLAVAGSIKISANSGFQVSTESVAYSDTATLERAVTGDYIDVVATGLGTGTVSVKSTATSSAVDVITFTVVAACAGNVYSPTYSAVQIRNDAREATSNVDEPLTSTVANGSTGYIALALRDAYNASLAGSGNLIASATNGAVVSWDGAASVQSSTAYTSSRGATGTELYVVQGDANEDKPVNTTVTITLDGTVVGTKSLTFQGVATTIDVKDVTVGKVASVGFFRAKVLDAAGNALASKTVTGDSTANAAAATAALVSANADATTGADGDWSAATQGRFNCSAAGTTTYHVKHVISAVTGAAVKKSFTVACGGVLDTWTMSLDKAAYAPGEVATLTISGKDSDGFPVNTTDGISTSGTLVEYSFGGMTFVTAPTATDIFNSAAGQKKYTLSVGTTEGSFVGTIKLIGATTDTAAKTVQYKVANPTPGVSNADVLKSIVSLIASINKQIRALQKLILRR